MFELKNVTKFYNNNGVVTLGLHNINLKLNKGEIVAITGDSGSGKSTLLNVITSVDTYEEGEILYYGNETSYFNQNDMDLFRQNHVSFIFQKYNIIESYTVLQNVMLPLLMSGKNEKEAKSEALKIIDKVGLSKRIKNKGTELSGGEKQRCVIARALASDSEILACDEPTGNLDSKTGDEIIKLIKEVAEDKLVLIVTHNYSQVEDIVNRKITLRDGEIIEDREIKNVDDEEKHDLCLTNKKIKKKTLYKLSMQNIAATPKKTTFTSMIFLVISLITLVLSLLIVDVSYNASGSNSSEYSLLSDERLIVYDKEHNGLDIEKLNNLGYKVYPNNFYEETDINFTSIEHMSKPFKLTFEKMDYTVKKGNDISKDGDFIIVLPKGSDSFWYEEFYDNDLLLTNLDETNEKNKVGYVTGIAYSKEVTTPYLLGFSNSNQKIINSVYNNNTDLYYTVNNETKIAKQISSKETGVVSDKTKLYVPKYLENKISFEYIFSDIYEIEYPDIEIEYVESSLYGEPTLVLGTDYYLNTLTPTIKKVYEASVYSNDIKKAKNEILDLNYNVTIPTHVKSVKRSMDLVTLYMFMALLVIPLIGLFFVSFAIMSRIYQSKTRDYGVLRALGMVKKDLGTMVKIETITVGLISSVISLVLFIVVSLIVPKIGLIKDLSILLLVFYFAAILLFAYFTAKRFNSKLFKFSVSTKLKDGELSD